MGHLLTPGVFYLAHPFDLQNYAFKENQIRPKSPDVYCP